MLTNLRSASRSESHLKISRLRSNMRSNVSLLCPQSRQVTLDRRRPPNNLWTQVVSAILASNLLQKIYELRSVDRKANDERWISCKTRFLKAVDCVPQEFMGVFLPPFPHMLSNDCMKASIRLCITKAM